MAIIGAGSAGLVAHEQARAHGARRVLLIEGGAYGTTCARVGCMPSKLLIAAAEAARGVRRVSAFGVHTSESLVKKLGTGGTGVQRAPRSRQSSANKLGTTYRVSTVDSAKPPSTMAPTPL